MEGVVITIRGITDHYSLGNQITEISGGSNIETLGVVITELCLFLVFKEVKWLSPASRALCIGVCKKFD